MGKGDKWRKTDFKNFFENFANIKFKKKNNSSEKKEGIRVKGKTTYKY
jgi:hypothetical protein